MLTGTRALDEGLCHRNLPWGGLVTGHRAYSTARQIRRPRFILLWGRYNHRILHVQDKNTYHSEPRWLPGNVMRIEAVRSRSH